MFDTISADKTILNRVTITLTSKPVNDWPDATAIGVAGTRGTTIGQKIPLQFPPRIRSNSKRAKWNEIDARSYEPVAVWYGSDKTVLDIELKYVVGAGEGWGVDKISKVVHTIMGYYYIAVIGDVAVKPPLVTLELYQVAPNAGIISTWRMENTSIDQSDELILDGDKVYPQVTTVTMSLTMMTKISEKEGDRDSAKQLHDTFEIPFIPKKEWY